MCIRIHKQWKCGLYSLEKSRAQCVYKYTDTRARADKPSSAQPPTEVRGKRHTHTYTDTQFDGGSN